MTNHESHEYEERLKLGTAEYLKRELRRIAEKPLPLRIKRLTPDAVVPTKAHASDSGFDLYAVEDVVLTPGASTIVKTGIAIELPPGYEAQIRPRSGITAKTKLRVQLGTVDNGFTGELGIITDNVSRGTNRQAAFTVKGGGEGDYVIYKGDKLAQLVVTELPAVVAVEVSGFTNATTRGVNGFGSSGVRQ